MQVQAYLYFDGRAAEAIEFYKTALGATVNMQMLFKEGDKHMIPPGAEDKIMHADISVGESRVLISDGHSKGNPKFDGFALTITTKTVAEADKIFAALVESGKVTMPQTKTFFSRRFGMLTDRFGVNWIVLAAQ